MDENKPSPGAAIGSFIVIAILIAGAVYILGGQLMKKPTPQPETATSTEAVSTTSPATTTNSI